jgi:hypothetical protein
MNKQIIATFHESGSAAVLKFMFYAVLFLYATRFRLLANGFLGAIFLLVTCYAGAMMLITLIAWQRRRIRFHASHLELRSLFNSQVIPYQQIASMKLTRSSVLSKLLGTDIAILVLKEGELTIPALGHAQQMMHLFQDLSSLKL